MNTMDTDDLAAKVEALADKASRLRQDVAGLHEQLATTRGRVWWVALLAVVAFGLAGAVGITMLNTAATNARVDAGLCPVLALVVGGYDPSTRSAGPARDAYERSFQVMRAAYDGARCAGVSPVVPRRTGS